MDSTKRKKASILIIISFIFLVMLSIVGVSLIYIGKLANKETASYKDKIIAQFTAASGISYAIADRIKNAYSNLYDTTKDNWYFKREEYIDNNLNGYFDAMDTFIYETDQNSNGTYDTYMTIEETLNPSYKTDKGGVLIYLPTRGINEVTIQVPSDFLPPIRKKWLQFYKLKIIDNASGILINYPTKNNNTSNELTDSVVNLLNNLGEVVIIPQLGRKINDVHPLKLGERIKEIRKMGPMRFKEELTYDKYGTNKFSIIEFLAIKDFISVSMWRDPRTYLISSIPKYFHPEINKIPKEAYLPKFKLPENISFKKELAFSCNSPNSSIHLSFTGICPGFLLGRAAQEKENLAKFSDHLNNNYGADDQGKPKKNPITVYPEIEFEMRAPININTAPKEVLIAMLLHLQGYYYDKTKKTYVNPGKLTLSEPIDLRKAILTTEHIIAYRKKNIIKNFSDFKSLILGKKSLSDFDIRYINKDILDASFGFLSDIDKKIILANADPESHIYDFNPDATVGTIFNDISKYDLTFNTTEITFFSHGYYEIESLGFVVREFEDTEKEQRQKELEKLYIGMLSSGKSNTPYIRPQVFLEKKHYSEKFFKILSVEKVVSNVSLYETVKLSSQADFVHKFPIYQGDRLQFIEIPQEKIRIEGLELYPENLNAIDRTYAATYEGYITLKPLPIPVWKDQNKRLVFQADLQKDYTAQKGASRRPFGTAYSSRSLLDMVDIKTATTLDNGETFLLDYTKNSSLPDGFFVHEVKRINYEYCSDSNVQNPDQACKYGYITSKNVKGINPESYIYYKSFYKGKWNFPQKGYMEMWFKPTWNRDEQELSEEGSDTRTFFSMGDSRGIVSNNQEVEIRETRQVGLIDPEEIARTITANIPNVNRVIVEVPPEINNILSTIRMAFFRAPQAAQFKTPLPQQTYTIRYSVVVSSEAQVAPLERFAFFARNRELALFVGNNFSTFKSVDTFGNLRKTSVSLPNNWKAGSWHHIAFKWYGPKRNVRVFVDGKPSTNAYKPDFILNNINSMFFGSNRFRENKCNGFPLNADGTIASIRIYDNPNIVSSGGFAVPDRFSPVASIKRKNAYIESVLFPQSQIKKFLNHKLFGIILNGSINEELNVDLENQYGGFCIDLMIGPTVFENIACFGKFFKKPIPEVSSQSGGTESRYTPIDYKSVEEEPVNLSYSKGWISTNYLKLREIGNNEVRYRIKFESPFIFPLLTSPVLDSVIFLFLRNPIISTNASPIPGKL